MSLLPVVPPMHECIGPPVGEKVSLTNLCNRSVFTSTLGNPRSRAQGSHPADRRFRGRPFSPACFAGAGTILSVHGGAERPRGPFDLEWRRAWHRSRQLEPVFNLPPPGPWPGLFRSSRRSSRSACSALHEVADQTPDAPCRAALPTRPSVAERVFDGAKNPFHRRQANAAAFRARSAFYRRVSHATLPCWRAGECVEPPRIRRLCHRRSASDTRSPACRRLGPNA